MDLVEPEGDPEGEHRITLAAGLGPESPHGVGALAEGLGVAAVECQPSP